MQEGKDSFEGVGDNVNDNKNNGKASNEEDYEIVVPKTDDLETLFIRDLHEFRNNGFKFDNNKKLFNLGTPSNNLLKAGIPNLPIVITQSVINKAIGNKKGKMDEAHELPFDKLYTLFECVHNPILVMESATQNNSKIIITEIRDKKGETAIVPIHVNSQLADLRANVVASIYTKPNSKLGDLVVIAECNGEIKYVDHLKIKNWLKQVGQLQLLPKMLSQF